MWICQWAGGLLCLSQSVRESLLGRERNTPPSVSGSQGLHVLCGITAIVVGLQDEPAKWEDFHCRNNYDFIMVLCSPTK